LPPSIHARTPPSTRRLQFAALLEGSTLLVLVGTAVPLKYLAAWPLAVSVIGPIHGMAFLLYLWVLSAVASGDGWQARDIGIALLAALTPFGAFAHAIAMHRKAAEQGATNQAAKQTTHKQAPRE